ncbi:uncharacterized protein LOC124894828 [Capsicum annuum]|uniref:uncharacterized protein LOC124894828 n=1 Tax=Capsicum annuum TaxID=4072 RepID=UPI001FB0B0D3|nr:uncharacterized protein LOC124894828 [Capsicum annuum]
MPKRKKHVSSNQEPRKRKKLRSNSYGEISISKQLPFLPSIVNLTTAHKKSRFLRVQKLMYLINIKGILLYHVENVGYFGSTDSYYLSQPHLLLNDVALKNNQ